MGDRRMGERPRGADAGTRRTGGWLSGVGFAGPESGYPGEGLGLPRKGPGAAAPYGRRLLALFLDWVLSWLVAVLLLGVAGTADPAVRSLANLAVFATETWLLTALVGLSAGKLVCGLRVHRLGGGRVGFGWSLVRVLLVLTVLPALLWDRDYRGMHDRASGTVVVQA